MQVGILISCKSFYRVNALNAALREMRKIVIIYIVVFYNAKLLKQDICYILDLDIYFTYVIQPTQIVLKHIKTDFKI